jgi:hypothetical protein
VKEHVASRGVYSPSETGAEIMARIGNIPKSQLYAGPGYNLFEAPPRPAQKRQFEEDTTFLDEAAMADAAEAVREAEVEAVAPDTANLNQEKLQHMNIDELRLIAKQLDVPNRETITGQDELVAAIQRSL